jgi:hypothetical protein
LCAAVVLAKAFDAVKTGVSLLSLILAVTGLPAAAQSRLGDVPPGGVLRLPLDDVVPISRLRVEIDGAPVDVPLALDGDRVLVTLPPGLSGRDHDIVLLRRHPDQDVELGIWTFGVPTGQTETVMTGVIEVERRQGETGGETRYAGNGRIGFDVDDGRFRGGIGFVQSQAPGSGRAETDVTDYFLETRRAAFGRDLILRLGTQTLPSDSLLAEDGAWRGVSVRLDDPDGQSDVLGFALHPAEASGRRNLTGLEDPDARIAGVAGHAFPLANAGLRADILALTGRAPLASGDAGRVSGAAVRLSGPLSFGDLGQDIGDYALDYALSETHDPAGPARAAAWQAEAAVALLPQSNGATMELRLSASRVEADFFTPLNPDLIANERRLGAEVLYQSDEWQVRLGAAQARSNIAGDPRQPTDQFRDLTLDASFSPYVFTGGFLNGITFYGSAYAEDQSRLDTPAGGPPPDDFRLRGISLGMDRFQPDHSWAVGVAVDWLDDRSGRDGTERRQRVQAAYAFTPDDLTTLTLNAELGERKGAFGTLNDMTLETSLAFPIVPDLWSAYVEAGAIRTDAPGGTGAYFGAELKRDLSPATSILLRADYAEGAKADPLSPGQGWVLGLGLRHEFGSGGQ